MQILVRKIMIISYAEAITRNTNLNLLDGHSMTPIFTFLGT